MTTPTDREAVEQIAKRHEFFAKRSIRGDGETARTLRALLARAEAAEAKLEAYAKIISDIGTADAEADEWLEKNIPATVTLAAKE